MERDDLPHSANMREIYFNSHAHVERDCNTILLDKLSHNFNSHAHVERDVNNKV